VAVLTPKSGRAWPLWVLPGVAGFMLSVAVAVFLVARKPAQESLDVLGARATHMSVGEYRHLDERNMRVYRTQKATDEDLREARSDFAQKENLAMRLSAIGMFAALGPHSLHTKEAIALAKSYLAEKNKDGNIVAIVTLKRMGDSSWKSYAENVLHNDPSQYVRQAVAIVLRTK